ncbi:MAG: M48 family metallopeptidase [Desulfovermiculus sp.]|nr:M48 family metallopeptidase [Desulfovermiculus sp.]
MRYRLMIWVASLACVMIIGACATSPTGRSQLQLFSSQQLARMGKVSYEKMGREMQVEQSAAVNRYVNCVVREVTSALPGSADNQTWEVTVYDQDDTVNAFALPGGYIGISSGLLQVAENPNQLAVVVGHEIAHVIADHPNARLSTQFATKAGMRVVDAFLQGKSAGAGNQIMALLGVGSQVGVLLPFSRSQEQEADILGLEYMARAGFDPRQSIDLWQNMAQTEGGKPPEFLSTHPSEHSRIQVLEGHMDRAIRLYRKARQQGRTPQCHKPKVN